MTTTNYNRRSSSSFPSLSIAPLIRIVLLSLLTTTTTQSSSSSSSSPDRYHHVSNNNRYPPPPPPPIPPPEDGSTRWTNNDNNDPRRPKIDDDDEERRRRRNIESLRASPSSYGESSLPIHYNFPERRREDDDYHDDDRRRRRRRSNDDDFDDEYDAGGSSSIVGGTVPKTTRTRGDALIHRYKSTKRGQLLISLSSCGLGWAGGTFLTKSLPLCPPHTTLLITILLCLLSIPPLHNTNPYTTLVQSLSVLCLTLLHDYHRDIRRRHPTTPHIKALLKLSPRQKNGFDDNDEQRGQRWGPLICLAFLGGCAGGSLVVVVVVPPWMGGLVGAMATTVGGCADTAGGDLLRAVGRRAYSLVVRGGERARDLELGRKATTVGGKALDALMFLDGKHRIRDRVRSLAMWVYGLVMRVVGMVRRNVEGDDGGGGGGEGGGGGGDGGGGRGRGRYDERWGERRRRDDDDDDRRGGNYNDGRGGSDRPRRRREDDDNNGRWRRNYDDGNDGSDRRGFDNRERRRPPPPPREGYEYDNGRRNESRRQR